MATRKSKEKRKMKTANLKKHFTRKHASFSTKYPTGDARKKAVEELQKSQESSTSVFNNWMQSSSNINMASFVFSQEIAKRGKPYTDGEYIKNCFINASEELFRDFKNKADIPKRIKELPLSAKTIKDRTIKMCSNITTQHIEDLKLVSALSIIVDESCDINDTAQVSLFVRFMSHSGPKEKLLGLLPLKNGAKSMTGVRKGFVAILKEKIYHEILVYHCIIHREVLCAQTFPEFMELVITIINSLLAKALNHRQFKEFLFEMERNVLKRFASLFPEIRAFLFEKGVHYSELTDDQWIQNIYFMVDVTFHLNQLNRVNYKGKET
ncbi:general transcription factor II-I repeat domain-containing protein 2A-like [Xylocopa sonorina]|uniref:general transcription factor II-I repeat domain-containing protein 2A-like n=1 Tax=Xylocopa sonorina TaxID=1818115 RepID=UPI00403AE158